MNAPDRQGRTPDAPEAGVEEESRQRADDAPQASGVSSDSKERRTILVVENDEPSRRLIMQILAFTEYAALSAANGLEALDLLDRARVDLVLMDLSMPTLDGYQTVQRMRERPEYANTPVIAVSGFTEGAWLDLMRAGFSDRLRKPFRPKELLQMIDRLLSDAAQHESGLEER